jgi:predicted metal-binding membrane protein
VVGLLTVRAIHLHSLLVFAAAAAATSYFVATMSGGPMPMPGGWEMSMMWMVMPGQTWVAAAVVFTVMWLAMMVAMMLPSAMPMLLLYRRAATFRKDAHVGASLWLLGGAYFFVWTAFGVLAYAAGMTISWLAMRYRAVSVAVPPATAAALIAAGAYQLTPWKSACLEHCRDPMALVANHLERGRSGALRLGLHHGVYCAACCWALMVIQLVLGVMNLGVMIVVAAAITLEKLLAHPWGYRTARFAGLLSISGGLWLLVDFIRRGG